MGSIKNQNVESKDSKISFPIFFLEEDNLKAECRDCGKSPDSKNWKNFDYIGGNFFCSEHSPNSYRWCRLCKRTDIETEDHHLIPRSQGGQRTVPVCCSCHRRIHSLFTNKELANQLSTIEELRQMPEIQNYIEWIRKTDKRKVIFKESDRKKMKLQGREIKYTGIESSTY